MDVKYGPDTIEVLDGLEAVRRRPGMYVGDVRDGSGLHHLVWEVVGNSIDQHLARRVTQLRVDRAEDWITIEDDGPGIPVDVHRGRTSLEWIFTSLHSGATRDGHFPHVHVTTGLGGVGLAPVNALSETLEVESRWCGETWRARFERGRMVEPVASAGPTTRTGTCIRFRPDSTIFTHATFDDAAIGARLLELAYLFPLLTIRWQGAALAPEREGLVGLVRTLARGPFVADSLLASSRTIDDVLVDVALGWHDAGDGCVRSFVNCSATMRGTHENGVRAALVDVARSLGSDATPTVVYELLQPGLVVALHVGLLDPRYGSPTKDHLTSPIAAVVVRRAVQDMIIEAIARRPKLESLLRRRLRLPPAD